MKYCQIFIADIGEFRNRDKYRFVAEFALVKDCSNYMKYMRGKEKYRNMNIIIIESDSPVPANMQGEIKCICNVMGECLDLEEYGLA